MLQTYAGAAYPEDFPTKELLASALKSGRWAIDWWEGDARPGMFELDVTMYVRPAVKGFEDQLRHTAWRGECTFLTPTGCELTANQRPKECRYLKPEYDAYPKCKTHGGINKQTAAIAWLDRADELE